MISAPSTIKKPEKSMDDPWIVFVKISNTNKIKFSLAKRFDQSSRLFPQICEKRKLGSRLIISIRKSPIYQ